MCVVYCLFKRVALIVLYPTLGGSSDTPQRSVGRQSLGTTIRFVEVSICMKGKFRKSAIKVAPTDDDTRRFGTASRYRVGGLLFAHKPPRKQEPTSEHSAQIAAELNSGFRRTYENEADAIRRLRDVSKVKYCTYIKTLRIVS